jgi:Tol biopolymer transport system component
MARDGSQKKQLTFDEHTDFAPTVSADGRQIIFVSNRSGTFHLWRMNIDGGDQRQLTDGGGSEWNPLCSPLGNFVIYLSADTGKQNLWRLALDGGEPVRLTSHNSYMPAISPDGQWLAYSYWDDRASPPHFSRRVMAFDGGRPEKPFELPPSAMRESGKVLVRWSADGRALTYIDNRGGMANIWSLPLDGSPARQLTDFKDDRIFWFDWSRDGKYLACALGTLTSDVVLVNNLR